MPQSLRTITPQTARRLALLKQRLAGPRPPATRDGVLSLVRDLGCLQLDPINVVARNPFLVLWSRLGSYDRADLTALQFEEKRLFEFWAHAASIVLTEDYPIHQLLMRSYQPRRLASPSASPHRRRIASWLETNRGLRRHILAELRRRGPLASRTLQDRSKVGWISSGWTSERSVAQMLSILWFQGKVAVAGRNGNQKLWDLAERWLPEWTPREQLPVREIVRRAAQRSLLAQGVATANGIDRHFTMGRYPSRDGILAALMREGVIEHVRIAEDGSEWPGTWFVHSQDLPLLDRLEVGEWEAGTTLLSPFDNLIINRARTERLFGFHYRMEIYVPKEKRRFGYYVLPILRGDRFIGRVDPAMDRKRGRLVVHSVHAEPDAPSDRDIGRSVAEAVEDLARFVGASDVAYGRRIPRGWAKALR